jgi:GTPase SAR1 family protein
VKTADGFLLVFAVDDRASFDEVPEYRERIVGVRGGDIFPVIVLAAKSDLETRQIGREEGRELAAQLCADSFYEVSAKLDQAVREAFTALIREIVTRVGTYRNRQTQSQIQSRRRRKGQLGAASSCESEGSKAS